jgi:hypothetical protein
MLKTAMLPTDRYLDYGELTLLKTQITFSSLVSYRWKNILLAESISW